LQHHEVSLDVAKPDIPICKCKSWAQGASKAVLHLWLFAVAARDSWRREGASLLELAPSKLSLAQFGRHTPSGKMEMRSWGIALTKPHCFHA